MKKINTLLLSILGVATLSLLSIQIQANPPKTSVELQPVDDDMHHFMEYVFEPSYKRLKEVMASEPEGRNVWKAIKGDSLTLAEASNLLLHRLPEENAQDWQKYAVETRVAGGEFYQAARATDYAKAMESYKSMLKSCNACHDQFADGEHQLAP